MTGEPTAGGISPGGSGQGGLEAIPVGHDGLAMLAISITVIVLTGGVSWLVLGGFVLQAAATTGTTVRGVGPILVLGHRLRQDGSASDAFRARLARAAGLWRAAPGKRIVLLGGSSRPGQKSEAAAGRELLEQQGVPLAQIDIEPRSRHTLENLRAVRALLAVTPGDRPTLVTSRAHLARAALMARGMRIYCQPCAAEDRLDGPGARSIARESFLLHWYITGRTVAWIIRSRSLAARVT